MCLIRRLSPLDLWFLFMHSNHTPQCHILSSSPQFEYNTCALSAVGINSVQPGSKFSVTDHFSQLAPLLTEYLVIMSFDYAEQWRHMTNHIVSTNVFIKFESFSLLILYQMPQIWLIPGQQWIQRKGANQSLMQCFYLHRHPTIWKQQLAYKTLIRWYHSWYWPGPLTGAILTLESASLPHHISGETTE